MATGNGSVNSLSSGLGMLFAPSYQGKVLFTEEGTTWAYTMPSASTTDSFWGLAEGNGTVVVVGSAGLIYQAGTMAPIFTTHPSDQSVFVGGNTGFSVTAMGNPAPTLQWQVSTNGGSAWTNVSNGGVYFGTTTTTLTITVASLEMDGHRYRVLATNSEGSVTSDPAALTVTVPPAGFSADDYLRLNPDLVPFFANDRNGAWRHYWDYGVAEGRLSSDGFRVNEYIGLYADIGRGYANDPQGAMLHWMLYGRSEGRLGRVPGTFNTAGYLSRNPDLQAAFGDNLGAAFGHYLDYGVFEGRRF
ncbi:MAG: immunoglobulin domain-containing protein [Rhodanobacter sp.]